MANNLLYGTNIQDRFSHISRNALPYVLEVCIKNYIQYYTESGWK